jgi:hypothetical protein
MKAQRHFAGLVCLFTVFCAFQGVMWHWRPEPGWYPSWWQFHSLAWFGFYVLGPLTVIPVAALQAYGGVENDAALWAAFVFGVLLEFAFVYLVAFAVANRVLKCIHGFRAHEKVA